MQYHPNYALLNTLDYTPLPDYWIAVLFNRLMGARVLNATASEPDLRVYAHCYAGEQGKADGSVVLAFVSIRANAYEIGFDDTKLGKSHMDFFITSKGNELDTTDVLLNGQALAMSTDNKLPALDGKLSTSNPVQIEPYSVGFIHFVDASVPVCLN